MSNQSSKSKPDFSAHVKPRAEAAAAAEPKQKNRLVLLILAIACLVIFSVTGEMATVFRRIMRPSGGDLATLVLPTGKQGSITLDDYRVAKQQIEATTWLFGRGGGDPSEEEVFSYATLRKLADHFEIFVTDQELAGQIEYLLQATQTRDFRQLWRDRYQYPSAYDFTESLRDLTRVWKVQQLLAAGAGAVTDAAALARWSQDFQELRYEFVVFAADDFAGEAAALAPSEEELAAFFPDGLSLTQRAALEREDRVAFEALVLSADALGTAAVQAWAPSGEASEEGLRGFYDLNRFRLYLRDPEDPAFGAEPCLPFDEIRERVAVDHRLDLAIQELARRAVDAGDLEAFAAERGVEWIRYPDPVAVSELEDLPRIGHSSLAQLAHAELGKWSDLPSLHDDLAVLARPTAQVARELPPLAEVRDSVIDSWRESRQGELAAQAAQAFVDGLPRSAEAAAGDPVRLEGDGFARAAGSAGLVIQVQDWIAGRPRPTTDPVWGKDEKIRPWLRSQLGQKVAVSADDEVIGPLDNTFARSHVVARLIGRRPADTATIWPMELAQARNNARNQAQRDFFEQQLSYEGLAQAYQIEKKFQEQPVEG